MGQKIADIQPVRSIYIAGIGESYAEDSEDLKMTGATYSEQMISSREAGAALLERHGETEGTESSEIRVIEEG